ncbi:hypothetical protein DRQ32_10075 [bacterium]|nr:MAG: hypothetical protein DRQ32_10075 [bacterium]
MRRLLIALMLLLIALPQVANAQSGGRPAFQRGYLQPQFVQDTNGNVGMLWVKLHAGGHDLYMARRKANGALQDPVKVNSSDGDVRYLPLDQARPGIASGPGGAVGVSWFDTQGRLLVGISRNHGRSFGESLVVDGNSARPEHAFSDVAFDASGTLFVTWIDAREAPANAEEPAQLYIARIDGDRTPVVQNMTGEFTESICGCCRPDLSIRGRNVTATFRMAGADGYRDIHRIETGAQLRPKEPVRMGTPLWKISACPMAGPVSAGEFTWFLDGSTGKKRLMESWSSTAAATPVAAASVEYPASPRLVTGSEGPGWMLYLPGAKLGQVLLRDGGRWRVLVDEVPYFCSDITYVEGQLLMVGDKEGTLWMEAKVLN